MRDVFIVGVHTIKFGKYPDKSIKELTAEAVRGVLSDARIEKDRIQSAWFANSAWGFNQYQHCIRGQVALRPLGIDAIPITNVENACAGGSTAFHGAWKDVASGLADVSLAVGAEKIYRANKYAVFAGFLAGTDVETAPDEMRRLMADAARDRPEAPPQNRTAKPRKRRTLKSRLEDVRDQAVVGVQLGEAIGYDSLRKILRAANGGGTPSKGKKKGGGGDHSPFMDIYAYAARNHMRKYGSTERQLAVIAAKSHFHSSLNPNAQYRFVLTPEEVLADRVVALPLTRAMCAPIGDGSASAIVMSEDAVHRYGLGARAVRVRASILGSGRARGPDDADIGERLSALAYARAGLGPDDVDLVELHDATAFGELHQTEALGFFPKGEGGVHAERGETRIGGSLPVNTSGGLLSRGHPIGASGLAQIHELVTQLRGEAGPRQVEGARLGLAENGGGALGEEEAAMCIHILESPRVTARAFIH
jgi:acetyl-CoA acyltransferase